MYRPAAEAILTGFFVSFSLLTVPVVAQDAENKETTVDEQEAFTEEVTVTARKREETIQDVPFSVVATTEEILRDRGATSIEDVSANVAGFSVQNLGPGQSQVAIRGVSAGQIVRDQPGVKEQVGVYLDESVISLSLFTPDIDLFDMNRVEVLRGPQGTLFGAGSLSGTVRYISNQPQLGLSDSGGEFTASLIDEGELGGDAKVFTNVPLGEKSAMRIAAYYSRMGGFIDAVQPNLSIREDVNSGERLGVRWAFRFEPTEKLTITPRLIYQEVNTDGWNRADAYNILGNPFTTTRPAVNLGDLEQFTQFDEPFTDEFMLADLTISYDMDNGVTFTSITSVTDRDVLVVRDATALTASITGGSIGLPEPVYSLDGPLDDGTTAEVLTQELRFSGESDNLAWVAGLFYSTTERDYGQSLFVNGFEDLTGIPTTGLRAGKDILFFSDLSYELDQTAIFGEVTYSPNDKLDLTFGVRWYDFEEERDQIFDGIFGNDNNGTSLVSTPGTTSADGFAPRFILSYDVNEDVQLNAQVSKGIRLGGINDPLNVPLCTPEDLITFGGRDTWDDEELWNYEVGIKTTTQGGRGMFNLAIFYMDISDLQATVTAGSCSSRVVFNVPEARSQGIELEWTHQVSTFFDIALSASYNDSELASSLTSTDAAGNVSIVSGIREGNRLPTVPELQFALAGNYRWQMSGGWAGYFSGVYQHVGERFTQIGDQAAGFGVVNLLALGNEIGGPLTTDTYTFDPELPAYDIVNLRLGFLNEKWDVAFFIKNVTDERALLALDQERGTLARVGYLVNQPRTFGVTSRVKF